MQSSLLQRRMRVVATIVVLSLAVAGGAHADMRVFEQSPDAEHPDRPHRYLDLTAFAQPGVIVRFADAYAGITDSGPWLQRARFGFRAQIAEWLRMRVEMDLAPNATLQDAYFDFVAGSYLTVRAGQFQVPFLRAYQFNELNLGFLDRPLYTPISPDRPVIRYLSPRDVGFMATGLVGDVSPDGHRPVFEYQAGAFIGRGANITRNDDKALLLATRLQVHLLGVPEGVATEGDFVRNHRARLSVGSGFYSNCDDRLNWNRGVVADAELRYRGLYVSASGLWLKNGPAGDAGFGHALGYGRCTGGYLGSAGTPVSFVARGGHIQVQYVLPRAAFFRNQSLELLARMDVVDPVSPFDSNSPVLGGGTGSPNYLPPTQLLDSDNAPTQSRMTFGFNYYPTRRADLRLGVNYMRNREREHIETSAGSLVGVRNDRLWIQFTAGL